MDARLVALLGRVWPALPPAIARAEALGFWWADVSTAFARHEGPRAIAHVGVIALPLILDGRPCTVASIHAVCTDPERRSMRDTTVYPLLWPVNIGCAASAPSLNLPK